MSIPNLPTDNVYKFAALAGVSTVLVSMYIMSRLTELFFKRAEDALVETATRVREANTVPAEAVLAEKKAIITAMQDVFNWWYTYAQVASVVCWIFMALGLSAAAWGFCNWYSQVQRYQDELLSLQVQAARLEANGNPTNGPSAGGGAQEQSSPPAAANALAAPSSSNPSRSPSGHVPSTGGGTPGQSPLKGNAAGSRPAAGSASTAPNSSGGLSNPPSSTSGPVPSAGTVAQEQSPQKGSAATSPPAAGSASSAMAGPGKGNEANGKKLFVVKCVVCHKADGSGGVKLTGNATPDWRNPALMAQPARNDDALRVCITNGRPKSGMMAWSGQLNPAQIEDLIAYIHTFSKKK